jgi:glycosyltransferase involved in cell wall biosynthesis
MTRPRIAIAHDYLTQRGGAERVVLSMAKAFPDAAIYTTLYDPEGTYPEFADLNIITSGLNRVPLLRRKHRLALPFLASASNHMFVDADLIIASSSGWAHGFAGTGKRLVYCYSPARWLYLTTSYLGDKGHLSVSGMALSLLRPLLIRWDKSKAEQATQYLAISTVVRQRIHDVYGIEAPILAAPLSLDSDRSTEPVDELLDWADGSFHLVVSRLLPYKNVVAVIEAVAGTSQRLVIIGRGPLEDQIRKDLPINVRLLGGISDAQLRWVYQHALSLIAPSFEDFGLSPLEAGSYGKPTVALRQGGYLDTVVEGTTGVFFEEPTPAAIRAGIEEVMARDWDPESIAEHVGQFSETH